MGQIQEWEGKQVDRNSFGSRSLSGRLPCVEEKKNCEHSLLSPSPSFFAREEGGADVDPLGGLTLLVETVPGHLCVFGRRWGFVFG